MEYPVKTYIVKTDAVDSHFNCRFRFNTLLVATLKILFLLAVVICSGCATIAGEPTQTVEFNSTPDDATLKITDETGAEVFNGSTPASVTLDKSDGSYFGGKTYTVVLDKQGFVTKSITITARPNAWYLAGNFVIGGLIGWLIIDPQFGDMYRLSPDAVDVSLATNLASPNDPDRVHIVLLQDLPAELRKNLQPL